MAKCSQVAVPTALHKQDAKWMKHAVNTRAARRTETQERAALGEIVASAMMPPIAPVVVSAMSYVALYGSNGTSALPAATLAALGAGGAGSGGGGHLSSPSSSTVACRTASSFASMQNSPLWPAACLPLKAHVRVVASA
jgi:hypothetical protein